MCVIARKWDYIECESMAYLNGQFIRLLYGNPYINDTVYATLELFIVFVSATKRLAVKSTIDQCV